MECLKKQPNESAKMLGLMNCVLDERDKKQKKYGGKKGYGKKREEKAKVKEIQAVSNDSRPLVK